MAWTAPKTWTVNEYVTATDLNLHLRDNLLYLRDRPYYTGFTTSSGNTTSGTWSAVNASLTLTINHPSTSGFSLTYLVGFFGSFSVNSTTAEWQIGISVNGDNSTKNKLVGKAMVANSYAPVGATMPISLGAGTNTLSIYWAIASGAQLNRAYGWRIWALEIADTSGS